MENEIARNGGKAAVEWIWKVHMTAWVSSHVPGEGTKYMSIYKSSKIIVRITEE